MDKNDSDGDVSSEFSDADPAEILNSLKNIDDLDAELFGPKKTTPNVKKEIKPMKKKVSFHNSVDMDEETIGTISKPKPKTDAFDFDMDDPLADLLSDGDYEDDLSTKRTQSKLVNKKDTADDWLFADDDADDLLDDGSNKTKEKVVREEKKSQMSVQSLMRRSSTDELLQSSSPSIRKMTIDDFASNAAKMSPEKLASPYTASSAPAIGKNIKFDGDDDFGFGSYQPTVTPGDKKKTNRPSRRSQSNSVDFFDFLKEDDDLKSSKLDKVSASSPALASQSSMPRRQESPSQPRSATQSNEDGNENQRTRSKSSGVARMSTANKLQDQQVIYDTPLLTPTQDNVFTDTRENRPIAAFENQPSRSRKRSVESPFINGTPPTLQTPTNNIQLSEVRSDFSALRQPVSQSMVYQPKSELKVANGGESRVQTLESQLAHTRALLHNVELGYKSDLELTNTMYDSRIELLKSSFEDLKSRLDRELGSVRESYSARIGVLRNSMQSQLKADTSNECEHQQEIKRLRNLHLEALNECRLDGDTSVARLREAHGAEMEAVKNSTYHARNIESMMSRVEESTDRLQQLSSKYESAHRAMTQQSESIALSNKQLTSVVQNQLGQQQRLTSDAQIQMQQTASRLEGYTSEMNRKMEEQHYAMQLSHSNLQSAHTALQEERKQFMQQITLEREHLRKAHREMINIQNEIRQEAREDRLKLTKSADDITAIATRYEEAKITEAEQSTRRNREHEESINHLNMEKMELAKKRAQIEWANEKLASQKLDLNNKLTQFNEEKLILQQIQHELEQRESDMNAITQKAIESDVDKERVFAEAKRIEEEQTRKLAEIHNETKDLTKQRQMLAEERMALAQERNSGGMSLNSPLQISSSPIAQALPPTSNTVTPIRQRLMFGHPGSPGQPTSSYAGMVLWQHSAKKDQGFLEDEQFFLETLKNSPYNKK